ncbi:tyrosine--tRNA ligase [Thermogladius sp. KZ2Tp1]|uniref:tyrosine--tRNA ligase n=1 Tax=Thermogladius sp. KZ2Tp1 TaxID=3136289 RepID=UPI003DA9FC99
MSKSRFDIAVRNTLEVVLPEELSQKLESGQRVTGYLGFEPSGLVHVGWLIWMFKVRDLTSIGVDFTVLEATWHAYINDKLGGDMDMIRKAARFVRHVLRAVGVESNIRFVDAEELVSDEDYWGVLLKAAKATSLARVKRALTIMGRRAEEAELDSSKVIYPLMQVTDIFYLGVDIALGGMDQRKAHMLARDIAEKLGFKKPIAIHTPILTGLSGPGRRMEGLDVDDVLADAKMSKSKPETAIFIHDSPEEVESKVMKAYCPPGVVEFNPVMELNKYLLFQQEGFSLVVERPEKYGGTVVYNDYKELERAYVEGKLHPLDLKKATAQSLNKLLEDIRRRLFSSGEAVALLEELKNVKVTR